MKYGTVRIDPENGKFVLRVLPEFDTGVKMPEGPSSAGYYYFKSGITNTKDAALELADHIIEQRKSEIDRLTNLLTSLEQLRWDIRAGNVNDLLSR